MNRTETLRFKRVLEDMKAELGRALHKSLDRLTVSQSADPMDQMIALTERELDSQIINIPIIRLRSLEDALRAIEEGSYGSCTSCGGDIPPKRLEAVPWSSCCVACQERSEAPAAGRNEMAAVGGGGWRRP